MKAPPPSLLTGVILRKAKLARRRSRLVWPETAFLGLQGNVAFEARVALRESIPDYWHLYRAQRGSEDRAKFRSYLRAKIAALRILKQRV